MYLDSYVVKKKEYLELRLSAAKVEVESLKPSSDKCHFNGAKLIKTLTNWEM